MGITYNLYQGCFASDLIYHFKESNDKEPLPGLDVIKLIEINGFECTLQEFGWFLDTFNYTKDFKHLMLWNCKYENWPTEYFELFLYKIRTFNTLSSITIYMIQVQTMIL